MPRPVDRAAARPPRGGGDGARRLRGLSLGAWVALGGCAPAVEAPDRGKGYAVVEDLDALAPPVPPLCAPVRPSRTTWLWFSARSCPYCQALRAELQAAGASWRERDVTVVELVVDAESCDEAMHRAAAGGVPGGDGVPPTAVAAADAGGLSWTVGLAAPATVVEWGADRVPTLFVLRGGAVRGVVVGSAPVEVLLALQDRLDRRPSQPAPP